MKKLLLTMAGGLLCSAAMAHIIVTVYTTRMIDYEEGVTLQSAESFYLDDIERMELLTDSYDDEHRGENGIRFYMKNGGFADYYASQIDSLVWCDYVDPGIVIDTPTSIADANEAVKQMDKLYRCLNSFNDVNMNDWGFKTQLLTNSHPTLDTQATGWDALYNTQKYDAESVELATLWDQCYQSIFRCNRVIEALEKTEGVDADLQSKLTAEARTIRAFFYVQLATTFGRVPIFVTGEDHVSCGPERPRVESYAAMWDYVIDDLTVASEVLNWLPRIYQRAKGFNCSMNKGIALTYLGDAYMWKAYRCPELAADCYAKAAEALRRVIEEGPYELNESFATLWDPIPVDAYYFWNKEAILVQVLESSDDWSDEVPHNFSKFYAACPENGGWGSLSLSWEWYASYESGDKRRDASCVTGNIPASDMEKFGLQYAEVNHGYHPFLKEYVGNDWSDGTEHLKFGFGEMAPSIWSMKYWRNARADWREQWAATNIYWKRLPNVMLDYAECLFNMSRDAEGWAMIDKLRQRAFGNLEVGNEEDITKKYLTELNYILDRNYGFKHETYPLPLNQHVVEVTDAQSYYTALKEKKGFDSPVWKVAVNEERRKEFNSEWSLRPDLERSGYLINHIEHNYPKSSYANYDLDYPWTSRLFDFDPLKVTFPIPLMELRRNAACDQNAGY